MTQKITSIFKRYEKKYLINEEQFKALSEKIGDLFTPDEFGKSVIMNIYFDTPTSILIRRSIEKPVYKEKLRLRTYGRPDDNSNAFVEIKKKFKSVVYKRRVKMKYSEAYDYLINGKKVKSGFVLSLSDLCVGEDIKKLIDAGVYSFKIEGRRRRPEFVYSAVSYYRNILDGKNCLESFTQLKRSFNRGDFTKGLAFKQDERFISYKIQGHKGDFVGNIYRIDKNKIYAKSKGYIGSLGDAYKVIDERGYEKGSCVFSENINGGFRAITKDKLNVGDSLNITTSVELSNLVSSCKRLIRVDIFGEIKENQKANFKVKFNDNTFDIESEFVFETSKKQPLNEQDFINCFAKTGEYPYSVNLSVSICGNVFAPKSLLNELRRNIYSKIFNYCGDANTKIINEIKTKSKTIMSDINASKNAVITDNYYDFIDKNYISIYTPKDYLNIAKIKAFLEKSTFKSVFFIIFTPNSFLKIIT